MSRCIQIAKNGIGPTAPNPAVGCVIVLDETIIGEGFTSAFGGNHAEVNAINSVKDKALLKKATLYVTLEPCSHFGKTPPCTNLILENGIQKVVLGIPDPNSLVDGRGIKMLRASGADILTGVLEKECREHHKRFLTFHEKNRPYIILKWAESSDGFIAPLTKQVKKPVWISDTFSRQLAHKWRGEEQSILVGANTVEADDPTLTTREYCGRDPMRIVLDPRHRLSKDHKIFKNGAPTIVIGSKKISHCSTDTCTYLGINWEKGGTIAEQIATSLYHENMQSVIVEGGLKTLQTFIDENLWDEARVFVGKPVLKNGIKAPIIKHQIYKEERLLNDKLLTYKNQKTINLP